MPCTSERARLGAAHGTASRSDQSRATSFVILKDGEVLAVYQVLVPRVARPGHGQLGSAACLIGQFAQHLQVAWVAQFRIPERIPRAPNLASCCPDNALLAGRGRGILIRMYARSAPQRSGHTSQRFHTPPDRPEPGATHARRSPAGATEAEDTPREAIEHRG